MTEPVEPFDDLRQDLEEEFTIRVADEDLVPGVAAAGHVVDGPGYSILKGRVMN